MAAVVGLGMDDQASTDDRIDGAGDGHGVDGDRVVGIAFGVGGDVAQVAGVSRMGVGQGVVDALGVVMPAGRLRPARRDDSQHY